MSEHESYTNPFRRKDISQADANFIYSFLLEKSSEMAKMIENDEEFDNKKGATMDMLFKMPESKKRNKPLFVHVIVEMNWWESITDAPPIIDGKPIFWIIKPQTIEFHYDSDEYLDIANAIKKHATNDKHCKVHIESNLQ